MPGVIKPQQPPGMTQQALGGLQAINSIMSFKNNLGGGGGGASADAQPQASAGNVGTTGDAASGYAVTPYQGQNMSEMGADQKQSALQRRIYNNYGSQGGGGY